MSETRPLGIGLLVGGFICLLYALTIEAVPLLPPLIFDHQILRIVLFVVGLLAFSIGISLTTASDERREPRANSF